MYFTAYAAFKGGDFRKSLNDAIQLTEKLFCASELDGKAYSGFIK